MKGGRALIVGVVAAAVRGVEGAAVAVGGGHGVQRSLSARGGAAAFVSATSTTGFAATKRGSKIRAYGRGPALIMGLFGRGKKEAGALGAKSTAGQVAAKYAANIVGKTVVITGCNGGIGKETMKALVRNGATVVMGCRNPKSMKEAADEVKAQVPNAVIHEIELDLSSLDSVRHFAEEYQALGLPHLSVLINNAGIMAPPFSLSKDGYESQLATNHLGHFLLTNLLLPELEKAPSTARVVNLASSAHMFAPHAAKGDMDFERDYNFKEKDKYTRWGNYGMSKMANIHHAKELQRKFAAGDKNVVAVAVHPGVVRTNLFGSLPPLQAVGFGLARPFLKSAPQGAATSVYCAFADDVVPAEYYSDCSITKTAKGASNEEVARQLWTFSAEATASDYQA